MDQSSEPFAGLDSIEKAVIRHAAEQKVMLDEASVLSVSLKLEKGLRTCPAEYREELINARLKGPDFSRYFKAGQGPGQGQSQGRGQTAGVDPFKAARDALRAKHFGDKS